MIYGIDLKRKYSKFQKEIKVSSTGVMLMPYTASCSKDVSVFLCTTMKIIDIIKMKQRWDNIWQIQQYLAHQVNASTQPKVIFNERFCDVDI